MNERFARMAAAASNALGSWRAFLAALALIVGWLIGLFFAGPTNQNYSLLINTVTTIITFLAVFLIQNTANRSDKAQALKLDELIHAVEAARDDFIGLERATEAEIAAAEQEIRAAATSPPA